MTSPVWCTREPPLAAAAVLATGEQVASLAVVTAARLAEGKYLQACAASGWLVVLGNGADLPWTDGVRYLGWDAGLLMPTTLDCQPGADLVRSALPATPDELVVLIPDAVLIGPQPRRPADAALLQ